MSQHSESSLEAYGVLSLQLQFSGMQIFFEE